jgi:hypothetical protein
MTSPPPSSAPASTRARLEAIGFCGADDSANPRLLKLISDNYPLVEWGVLFRPDREGQPRYATEGWVSRLSRTMMHDGDGDGEEDDGGGSIAGMMSTTATTRTTGAGETRGMDRRRTTAVRLAAHLCGSHVNDLLDSSNDDASASRIDAFLRKLIVWGFGRVQVNATSINGVETERLFASSSSSSSSSSGGGATTTDGTSAATSFIRTTIAHPDLEFIVQRNDETEPLWSALLLLLSRRPPPPGSNVVFLHDESKGTGTSVPGGLWPTDGRFVMPTDATRNVIGYAGGIRPTNVMSVAEGASIACAASGGDRFWIDMETGIRTTVMRQRDGDDGTTTMVKEDIFDISKCYDCIDGLCEAGWIRHPPGLRR